MIQVVSCKTFKGQNVVYIGRPSIFGNPFPINRFNDRSAVIKKYRTWLWTELQKDSTLKDEFIKFNSRFEFNVFLQATQS